MVSERLNGIALMHVHQEIVPDIEKVWIYFLLKAEDLVLPRHSVHSARSAGGKGGVEPPTKFSKSRGLKGPQLLELNCWERGDYFFQGLGCNFQIKNKLKSENLMSRKVYKRKYFSLS